MSYQSPLHILENFQLDYSQLNNEEIIKIRKKLLAEFNLTGETTIKVNGKSFSKDDIIKQIDSLKDIADLETHALIFKSKKILKFFEAPKKTPNPVTDIIKLYKNNETSTLFKSIATEAEISLLKYKLSTNNYSNAQLIINFFNKTNFENASHVFEIIELNLNQITTEIENATHNSFSEEVSDRLMFLRRSEFYYYLNELPDEFEDYRNNIARNLINFIRKMKNENENYAIDISSNLLFLNCDNELKRIITYNHDIYTQNDLKNDNADYNMSWKLILKILFIILIIVFKCSRFKRSQNRVRDSQEYNMDMQQFQVKDIERLQNRFDSMRNGTYKEKIKSNKKKKKNNKKVPNN